MRSFVASHTDYCNSLLYSLPQYQYDRFPRVLNWAARVVCLVPKFDHITPVLRGLQWLKILLLGYMALPVKAPSYISGLLRAKPAGRYSLGSDSPDLLAVPRTMFKTLDDRAFAKAGPSLWSELPVDTRHQWRLSKASWRLSFSGKHLAVDVFNTDLWLDTFSFWFLLLVIINSASEYL